MPHVAEDTIPAEADCGLRRFSVTAEDGSRISIQVMQETTPEDCPGETHVAGIQLNREVCTNGQITQALLQIAAATVRHPSRQSLPEEGGRKP